MAGMSDAQMSRFKSDADKLSADVKLSAAWGDVHPRMKRAQANEQLSNWLLAVTGATAALLLSNYGNVVETIGSPQLRIGAWALFISGFAGLVAKLFYTAAEGSMSLITEAAAQNDAINRAHIARITEMFEWFHSEGITGDASGVRAGLERWTDAVRLSPERVASALQAADTIKGFLRVHYWCVPIQWIFFIAAIGVCMSRLLSGASPTPAP